MSNFRLNEQRHAMSEGRVSPPIRALFFSVALMLLSTSVACTRDSWAATCVAFAICDTPVREPTNVKILCDNSPGGPCTPSTLIAVVDSIVGSLGNRPGSRVSLTALGADAAHSHPLGTFTIPQPPIGSPMQLVPWRRRMRDSARVALSALFPGANKNRTSPIAATLSAMALEDDEGRRVVLYAITDGLEQSSELGHFECGTLPSPEDFARRLKMDGLLTPSSLRGRSVVLAFLRLGPVDRERCMTGVQRERQIQALWRAALRNADADTVIISSGVAPLPLSFDSTLHLE